MTGMGNLSLMVNLLRDLKSRHMCQAPSFFKTMTTRDDYGLMLGWITPTSKTLELSFQFHFFVQMDIDRGVHLVVD